LLSIPLMKWMGTAGLALAMSIAATVNFIILLRGVSRLVSHFPWKSIAGTMARSLLLSLGMSLMVAHVAGFLSPGDALSGKFYMAGAVFTSIAAGVLFYGAGAFYLKFPEALLILKAHRWMKYPK
ncbi:MAG: polysaccharide biosynthesis C-terminal domain-containing protein, partial [Desulfamplus sp.]|nr:polysaccharide biosynthesis C-terminal domain-containing protein [Desulfamplus sp.]